MKHLRFDSLLSTLPLLSGFAFHASAAPTYWDPLAGGNGHWYEPVKAETTISWENAKIAAENAGGYLATLTTSQENDFVYSLISDPFYWRVTYADQLDLSYIDGPMIGLFQPAGSPEPAGGWQWLNGEGGLEVTYSNWHPTEPDNYDGIQHRGLFFTLIAGLSQPTAGNTWGDVDGSYPYQSYVIEYNALPQDVPETSTCAAIGAVALLAGFQFLRSKSKSLAL